MASRFFECRVELTVNIGDVERFEENGIDIPVETRWVKCAIDLALVASVRQCWDKNTNGADPATCFIVRIPDYSHILVDQPYDVVSQAWKAWLESARWAVRIN